MWEVDKMDGMKRSDYCDAYDKSITKFQCKNCTLKEFFNVYEYDLCPYYGVLVNKLIKIKKEDFKRLNEYAKRDGNGSVSYYIRKAIAEYLDKYE